MTAPKLEDCIVSLRDLMASDGLDSIEFVHSGALTFVLFRAGDFVNAPGCSEQACRFSHEKCAKLVAARTIATENMAAHYFAKVMKAHMQTNASVAESAICALGAACICGHARNTKLENHAAGIQYTLSAMRRWKESRSLQGSVPRAIKQTSEDNLENQR
jgi:hypothetical protein